MSKRLDEAKAMIKDLNGTYNKISTKLILLLVEWEKTI
jgi:hypothetical protein